MGYYISPRFLDKLSVHITKNYLKLPGVRVPLILGVHGRKGEGKTFMCELVFERMGLEVVHISAGELESPDAGDPARLIRLRYREAAELVKVRGHMAVLMINDVDAGIGRVDAQTQYTVNTQLVNATLMNIADNPTNVQLPGSYDPEPIQRIPILLTGNDFATLYAPLIRDGRMEKFFWDPDRSDRLGIIGGIFDEELRPDEVESLVEQFPQQSIDFFSALRSQLYDEQVRDLIQSVGIDRIAKQVVHSDGKPTEFHRPNFSLPHLFELGQRMVREQERIRELRLVEAYHTTLQGNSQRPDTTPPIQEQEQEAEHSPNQPVAPSMAPQNGSSVGVPDGAIAELERLLASNHQVGIEYVDERRFRTGSWQCYGTFKSTLDVAIAGLKACIAEYPRAYVRIVGISPERRRVAETIVQRPEAVHR
ncbi:AAA family ATPase [filamentous cyanobacterium LEGE 07170]|nr:AAA family ATPase [filamentous cyanobacterium LEGE 07170]